MLSIGTFLSAKKLGAEEPSTSRVLTTTGLAPQDCISAKVPRTADPALITSSMIAIAFP